MAHAPQIMISMPQTISDALADLSAAEGVAGLVPGSEILRLDLKFGLAGLREALDECPCRESLTGDMPGEGFTVPARGRVAT